MALPTVFVEFEDPMQQTVEIFMLRSSMSSQEQELMDKFGLDITE